MSLDKIFCQDRAIGFLQQAFAAERVPHAYIFAGLQGVGKFTTALAWAKLLLCFSPILEKAGSESCGKCSSCKMFDASSHPDMNLIYKELAEFTKDGGKKTAPVDIPINVVREFFIEKVSMKPSLSNRSIFIVDETERLNTASQNALLKVLEEPPPFCHIILICSNLEKLLPTTRSRCQVINFGRINEEKIIEYLSAQGFCGPEAEYFARLSYGSLAAAEKWSRLEAEGAGLYDIRTRLLKTIASYNYSRALDISAEFLNSAKTVSTFWSKLDENTSKTDLTRKSFSTIIQMAVSIWQDVMKLDLGGSLINSDQSDSIKIIAEKCTPQTASQKLSQTACLFQWVDSSVNEKLIFDHLLLNLEISDTIPI